MTPPRSRFRQWCAGAGLVVLFVTTVWLAIRHLTPPGDAGPKVGVGAAEGSVGRYRPLAGLPGEESDDHGAGSAASGAPYPAEDIGPRVDAMMKQWREAIINKNPEMVEALDRAFASHPREFVPALMVSAETDAEERVRSFSTRVLGKLRPPQSAPLIRKLLSDRSEYVRFNAAWALGQLDDRAALSRLRSLGQHDPSISVRRSANESLRKLEGG